MNTQPRPMSGSDLAALWLFGLRIDLTASPQHRLNSISDARRQDVGPLADGVVSAANGLRRLRNASAEQFEGFLFRHACN